MKLTQPRMGKLAACEDQTRRPGHPADVPADNNSCERDIRSVVAARNDGGVNRSDWTANAFATLKSVIRTCRKNGLNFLEYGLNVLHARTADVSLPLPLDTG